MWPLWALCEKWEGYTGWSPRCLQLLVPQPLRWYSSELLQQMVHRVRWVALDWQVSKAFQEVVFSALSWGNLGQLAVSPVEFTEDPWKFIITKHRVGGWEPGGQWELAFTKCPLWASHDKHFPARNHVNLQRPQEMSTVITGAKPSEDSKLGLCPDHSCQQHKAAHRAPERKPGALEGLSGQRRSSKLKCLLKNDEQNNLGALTAFRRALIGLMCSYWSHRGIILTWKTFLSLPTTKTLL